VLIGLGIAWQQYGARKVPREAPKGSLVTTFARKDLYGDALNESLVHAPWSMDDPARGVLRQQGCGRASSTASPPASAVRPERLRKVQTGFARTYALSMFLGAAILVGALLLVRI